MIFKLTLLNNWGPSTEQWYCNIVNWKTRLIYSNELHLQTPHYYHEICLSVSLLSFPPSCLIIQTKNQQTFYKVWLFCNFSNCHQTWTIITIVNTSCTLFYMRGQSKYWFHESLLKHYKLCYNWSGAVKAAVIIQKHYSLDTLTPTENPKLKMLKDFSK